MSDDEKRVRIVLDAFALDAARATTITVPIPEGVWPVGVEGGSLEDEARCKAARLERAGDGSKMLCLDFDPTEGAPVLRGWRVVCEGEPSGEGVESDNAGD